MKLKYFIYLVIMLTLSGLVMQELPAQTEKKIIKSNHAPKAIGPYNQAVLAGNTIYLSGQIPLDPITDTLVTGDIEKETHQVMKNISAVLKEAGFSLQDVVSATIYMTDLNDYAVINKVYASYYEKDYPARVALQVCALPKNSNVEISVIAVR